jgi:hypothetical protein
MSTETKKLTTISFVTNTDVSYYQLGEIEGSFEKQQLKDYIKRFGHEKICTQLAFSQSQVCSALREVNSEKDYENCSVEKKIILNFNRNCLCIQK